MKVLLVRHGIAEEAGFHRGQSIGDEARELTEDGREKIGQASQILSALLPHMDSIASSELLRAQQTAEIIASRYALSVEKLKALAPYGSVIEILSWLSKHEQGACLCLVGHEPALGYLAGWLLSGEEKSFIRFKPGGLCLIEFSSNPVPGTGVLVWALSPAQLEKFIRANPR